MCMSRTKSRRYGVQFVTSPDIPESLPVVHMLIIFTTAPDKAEAETLAESLVKKRLAACVQVVPGMTSFYFWEDEVQKDSEFLLLIKTSEQKYGEVEEFILENHSYDEPEIVAVDSEKVSEGYRTWLEGYLGN